MENQKRALLFIAAILTLILLIEFLYPRVFPPKTFDFSKIDRRFFTILDSLRSTEEDPGVTSVQSAQAPSKRKSKTAPALLSPVNLNTATREQLTRLPGIGPTLAERILTYRRQKGKFSNLSELMAVKGIGKKKFERLKPLIRIQ